LITLKQLRLHLGLTQVQLAEILHWKQPRISHIESECIQAQDVLNLRHIDLLARALDIKLIDLILLVTSGGL
jgi:DNA-binding helix-turn-helix protein